MYGIILSNIQLTSIKQTVAVLFSLCILGSFIPRGWFFCAIVLCHYLYKMLEAFMWNYFIFYIIAEDDAASSDPKDAK